MADVITTPNVEPTATAAPVAAVETTATERPDEDDDIGLVDAFEELLEDIEAKQAHLGTPAFNNNLNSRVSNTIKGELQNNVYELLKEVVVLVGRGLAERYEQLEEDFDELKTMVFEQRRALRDIATNNVLGAAAMLAKLTLARSNDIEAKQIAQAIINAIGPILNAADVTPSTNSAVIIEDNPLKTTTTPSITPDAHAAVTI